MFLVTSLAGKFGRASLETMTVRETVDAESLFSNQYVSSIYIEAGKHWTAK